MTVPDPSHLANQLFAAAKARAAQHGIRFRPGASSNLRSMAETGAENILSALKKKPAEDQDAYLRAALRVGSESMVAFVDEMTSARFRIPGYLQSRPDSMGEQTWQAAKDRLCPLWPIC